MMVDAQPRAARDGNGYECLRSLASRRPEAAMVSSTSGANARITVAAARLGRHVANTAHGRSQRTFTVRTA